MIKYAAIFIGLALLYTALVAFLGYLFPYAMVSQVGMFLTFIGGLLYGGIAMSFVLYLRG